MAMKWDDADNLITLVDANIIEGKESQFEPCLNCDNHGTEYDCDSIMH